MLILAHSSRYGLWLQRRSVNVQKCLRRQKKKERKGVCRIEYSPFPCYACVFCFPGWFVTMNITLRHGHLHLSPSCCSCIFISSPLSCPPPCCLALLSSHSLLFIFFLYDIFYRSPVSFSFFLLISFPPLFLFPFCRLPLQILTNLCPNRLTAQGSRTHRKTILRRD